MKEVEEIRLPDLLDSDDTASTDSTISYASGFGVLLDRPSIGFQSEDFRPLSPSELKRFEREDPLRSVGMFAHPSHGPSHQQSSPLALPSNSRVVLPTNSKRRDIGVELGVAMVIGLNDEAPLVRNHDCSGRILQVLKQQKDKGLSDGKWRSS